MKKKLVFVITVLAVVTSGVSQKKAKWLDKEENENYVARHECSFVQSGNQFIMFGGRESAKQLDIYDYKNNKWKKGAEAPVEFNHFQATEYQGLVWVVGAFETNNYPNEVPASHIYMYNPGLDAWIQGPEIPEDRRRGGAGLVMHNNKFYLVAGNTKGHNGGYIPWLDEYDPTNNTWKRLEDAPHARDHFSAVVYNNKIYAASGRLSGGAGGTFTPLIAEVDVYDFKTKKWTTLTEKQNIPTPRAGAAVCLFQNEIYVMGGESEAQKPAYNTVEAFNFEKGKWKKKKAMNHERHGTQAIISGDGIHIAGGSPTRGGGNQHNMEVYGIDNPKGEVIVASTLVIPDTLILKADAKNITFSISNESGNTAILIKKAAFNGYYAKSFKVVEAIENRLLKVGESFDLTITHEGLYSTSENSLVITYDNGIEKTIHLTVTP